VLNIEQIKTGSKAEVRRFVEFPYKLYRDCPQWVPPLFIDAFMFLNRKKHPFYEHSEADFFVALRGGEVVGRIAAIENKPYNSYHHKKQAQFYLFDTIEDQEVAAALFERVFEWARSRGLNQVVGPKGFGPLDGYGIQVEGFEHRQVMTMMNYNYAYYQRLVEELGFRKEVDFVSCYIHRDRFQFPERIHKIAARVEQRGALRVKRFRNKKELVAWAPRIGKAYNDAFVNNWEYFPLSEREVSFVMENIMVIADPRLIKVITHGEDIVGFLFAFPDLSAALQRAGGRLFPFGLIDLLLELRRTKWVAVNGIGILPDFQGRGGNALMYSEMAKTMQDFQFEQGDLTQVAETAWEMRQDLLTFAGKPYKNHRVYIKDI
jgi:GNAT superfamily N-acetyltransferase